MVVFRSRMTFHGGDVTMLLRGSLLPIIFLSYVSNSTRLLLLLNCLPQSSQAQELMLKCPNQCSLLRRSAACVVPLGSLHAGQAH